jgi:hypothetical protein
MADLLRIDLIASDSAAITRCSSLFLFTDALMVYTTLKAKFCNIEFELNGGIFSKRLSAQSFQKMHHLQKVSETRILPLSKLSRKAYGGAYFSTNISTVSNQPSNNIDTHC